MCWKGFFETSTVKSLPEFADESTFVMTHTGVGANINHHKSWHTQSNRNLAKVYEHEKKRSIYLQQALEARKLMAEGKDRKEIEATRAAVHGVKKSENPLSWMYQRPETREVQDGTEPLAPPPVALQAPVPDPGPVAAAAPLVEMHGTLTRTRRAARDAEDKLRDDPLLAIKFAELRAAQRIAATRTHVVPPPVQASPAAVETAPLPVRAQGTDDRARGRKRSRSRTSARRRRRQSSLSSRSSHPSSRSSSPSRHRIRSRNVRRRSSAPRSSSRHRRHGSSRRDRSREGRRRRSPRSRSPRRHARSSLARGGSPRRDASRAQPGERRDAALPSRHAASPRRVPGPRRDSPRRLHGPARAGSRSRPRRRESRSAARSVSPRSALPRPAAQPPTVAPRAAAPAAPAPRARGSLSPSRSPPRRDGMPNREVDVLRADDRADGRNPHTLRRYAAQRTAAAELAGDAAAGREHEKKESTAARREAMRGAALALRRERLAAADATCGAYAAASALPRA